MHFDEMLVRSLADGTGCPTIRVYGWEPPAISLGWNQRLEEIDVEKAAAAGIEVVRRPTGGRAILHSDELTYSVTMPAAGRNILAVYNEISRALVEGLKHLGADVSLEKSQPHFPSLYQSPSSAACFSSSARYEIQIGGRKLVGSAQRRYVAQSGEDVVLQHGSLLLGDDHRKLVEYLKLKNSSDRERLSAEMEEKTIDLATALGRRISFDQAAEAIRIGFEGAWKLKLNVTKTELTGTGQIA